MPSRVVFRIRRCMESELSVKHSVNGVVMIQVMTFGTRSCVSYI